MNPGVKGIEIILTHENKITLIPIHIGIKYIGKDFFVKKYKVKLVKRYSFTLEGENKEYIKEQVNTILNHSKILDLPYVRKNISVKIRELKNGKDDFGEENN